MLQMWKMTIALVAVLAIGAAAYGVVAAQTDDGTPTATESPEAEATATATEDVADTPTAEAKDDATTPDEGDDATKEGDERTNKEELRDAYLARLAQELGISQQDLEGALTRTALAMLDQAVADGRISEDEAAKIRQRIESGDLVPIGPGFGIRHGGHMFAKGFHLGVELSDLASFLGVDEQVVTDGLRNGQSLAQIAEASGKSRDELRAHLLSQLDERLSKAVADGDITQAQADERRTEAESHIDDLIDREGFPGPVFHHDGPRGGFAPFEPPAGAEDGANMEPTSL